MHRIYYDKRCLAVCSVFDNCLNDPNAILYSPGSQSDLLKIPLMFEKNTNIRKLYIPTHSEEGTYKQICSAFTIINAAGGLVTNRRGDYLLIYRNGLWDLPKGKQEPGEDMRITALREVEEECGIKELEIKEMLGVTDHFYRQDNILYLKHTYWYRMSYNQPTDLTPQLEEDIESAAWVAKSSLPKFLNNTYPSIIEVFKYANIL